MTANRWWVRVAARWLARVDGVSSILRLAMLGLTGISTMSLMLREYGLGNLVIPAIGIIGAGTVVFAYLYAEGGVWNQVRRDKSDLSKNYSTPFQRISNEMTARGLYAGEVGRELTDEEREAIKAEIGAAYCDLRDGVDVEYESEG